MFGLQKLEFIKMNSNIRLKIASELAKIAEDIITAGRPKMTKEEFIERAREIHGDRYDYSKVDMDNRDDKGRVFIKCKKCGSEFWQRPDKHLDGNGCMNCYVEETGIIPGQDSEEDEIGVSPQAPVKGQKPVTPQQQSLAPAPQSKPVPQPSQFQQSLPLKQPLTGSKK